MFKFAGRWRLVTRGHRWMSALCVLAALAWAQTAAAQPIAYVVGVSNTSPKQVELRVINTATSNITMQFTIAPYVASPAPNVPMTPQVVISPDRRTAYVTAGDVFVVDIVTGGVVATGLGTTLGPLALNAAGTLLYVADQGGKRIVVMDTTTRQFTGSPVTLTTMPSRLALSADGGRLVVLAAATARAAYVVDTASRTVITTIATGEAPVEMSVHPDGSRVFVGHSTAIGFEVGADTLVSYDTTSGLATATLTLPDFSGMVGFWLMGSRLHQMALLPSGTKLYIPRFRGGWTTSPTSFSRTEEVVVVDMATLTVTSRLALPIVNTTLAFGLGASAMADGSRVLVAGGGSTSTIDPSTDTLTTAGPGTWGPTWVAAAAAPPCWVELTPQRVVARTAGTTVEIPLAVEPGCAWAASTSGDFFTASPSSGTGPSTMSVQVVGGSEPQVGTLSMMGQTVQVERTDPHIVLDNPSNGALLTLPFDVTGWAIERRVTPGASFTPSSGISAALVYDQTGSSPSTYFRLLDSSRQRQDVGAAFGAAYGYSGFTTTVGRLSAGVHTLSVHPRSALDATLLTPATATVTVLRQPRVELDSPQNSSTVMQPFDLVGWAADMTVPEGTGVDAVHVWAHPAGGGAALFVGVATLGISRADVGNYFNEQPLLAGFRRTVSGLPPGRYTLTAYAHYTATDTFEASVSRDLLVDPVTLVATPSSLRFAVSGAVTTGAQLVRVTMSGQPTTAVAWSVSLVDPYGVLEVRTADGVAGAVEGVGAGAFQVALRPGANVAGLAGTVATVRVSGAGGEPAEIPVTLQVAAPTAPIGFFDTPSDGASVSGAIAVTGWAVDDIEVTRVAVYRSGVGSEPSEVYLGDGSFVEGARPDVAALFPNHPRNTRAGWGMAVLTNMLPNQGNGTFTLYAYAYDGDGLSTLLGTKIITGNNATATRPFGTIDVPAEGATVSGDLVMFGWILTPSPAIIPVDGSTIEVLVDGVLVGRPTFNQCRGTNGTNFPPVGTCNDDIATLFGNGYRNISEGSGAIGAFVLDTRTLTTGRHHIQWRVTDSLNRVQGIGSRYIYVQN